MITKTATQPKTETEAISARQIVSFSFLKISPEWLRLSPSTKRKHSSVLVGVIDSHAKQMMILTYSLIGLKADVDFMIWGVGQNLEDIQHLSSAVRQTPLGGYLTVTNSYLSMTKRSTYVDKLDPEHQDKRRFITPAKSPYLFVYPFAKTREWYHLPLERRQEIMDEHIIVGKKYPSVRLHTTYSFGLDDQEFVVAFETDSPNDFLDLVMELRGTEGSRYTLRDTPIFSCIAMPMSKILGQIS